MLAFTLMVILGDSVLSQVILPGKCPEVQPVEHFNAPKYLGKWYEAEKYFFLFELGGECITATYDLNDNGTLTVTNSEFNVLTRGKVSLAGLATFDESPAVAKLTVVFPSLPVRFPAPYWVIGTDYGNYAVVWSCVNVGFLHSRFAWILTREQVPKSSILNDAYAVLEKFNISKSLLIKTRQENC